MLPSDFLWGVLALRSARPLRLLVVEEGDAAQGWQQAEGLRWLRELAVQQQWTVVWGMRQAHGMQTSPALWDTRLLLKRVAMASTKRISGIREVFRPGPFYGPGLDCFPRNLWSAREKGKVL